MRTFNQTDIPTNLPRIGSNYPVIFTLLLALWMMGFGGNALAQLKTNTLAFDGIDDKIVLTTLNNAPLGGSARTIEAWIKTTASSNYLFSYGTNYYYQAVNFFVGTGVAVDSSDSFVSWSAGSPLNDGQWHHIAWIYPGGVGLQNSQVYADGVLMTVISGNYNGMIPLNTTAGGVQPHFGDSVNGEIDELRLWNVARTQTEIQANKDVELTGTEPGLVTYYNFNQCSGSTLPDLSGNGNNGTLTNMTGTEWTGCPAPVSATNVTTTGFTANWNAVNGATKYRIDVGNASFSTLVASNLDAGTGTSFDVTGLSLTPGTPYYYRMRVEKGTWTSPNSASSVMLSPGNVLQFDGTNSVTAPADFSSFTKYTIEAWVKPTATAVSNIIAITNGGPGFTPQLGINSSGQFEQYLYDSQERYVTGTITVISNQWYHVAVTAENNGPMHLYVNGIEEGTPLTIGTFTPWEAGLNQFYLAGSVGHYPGNFTGLIDEVRVWNVARTQTEIQSNLYKTLTGNEAGLVAYYNFDHASGTVLSDVTGHGHNGTLVNNPLWTPATWNYGYPYILTGVASAITDISASVGGNVVGDGIPSLSASGICYGTSTSPTTPCTTDGTNLGTFTSALTGLTPNTLYYARQYATNALTTVYGNEVTLTTLMGNQVISFTPPTSATYEDAPLTLSATGGNSGNPVTFSSTTTSVCTTGSTNGTTLTIIGTGTCTVTANQAGNSNYNAALPVNGSITINPANQVISFTPPTSATYGDSPLMLSATGGNSGNPVTFTSTTTSVCTTGGTHGATLTIIGTGTCTVTANQLGNTNYNAAPPVSSNLTLKLANQTINFAPLGAAAVGDPPMTLTASASSGLPVTLATTTPSACTVSDATLLAINAGTCTVTANQGGNVNYNAAPQVVQEIEIKSDSPNTLQIVLAGQGQGQVTSKNPVGIDCSSTTSACALTLDNPQWVSLITTAVTGSTFVNWTGDPECSKDGPGKVFLQRDLSCTATFDLQSYTLTVEKNAPGATVTGEEINCPDTCQATYPYGTTVKLEAGKTPLEWEFVGWGGSCDSQGQVTITADKTCRAQYREDPNIPALGDGNGDGQLDAHQANVMSLADKMAGNYITLEVNPECVIADGDTVLAETQPGHNSHYPAPQGLMYFDIQCSQATVTMYFHGLSKLRRNFKFRKVGPTIPGEVNTTTSYEFPAQFGIKVIDGKPVVTATYSLIDGQLGDSTGVDGHIVDPGGIMLK